jgi:hypothetical protein
MDVRAFLELTPGDVLRLEYSYPYACLKSLWRVEHVAFPAEVWTLGPDERGTVTLREIREDGTMFGWGIIGQNIDTFSYGALARLRSCELVARAR